MRKREPLQLGVHLARNEEHVLVDVAEVARVDRLAVAEQDLATAQTILKDLTFEETVGTANALDVAQQATTVAVLNASIPPLRQQLRQTVDALAVLTGRMPQECR